MSIGDEKTDMADNWQLTQELLTDCADRVCAIVDDLGLETERCEFERCKPGNGDFMEIVLSPGCGYLFRFDWSFVPPYLDRAEKFEFALFEIMYQLRFLWQIEHGVVCQLSEQERFDDAITYVDDASKRLMMGYSVNGRETKSEQAYIT